MRRLKRLNYKQLNEQGCMDKQKTDALVIYEATIGEDIEGYVDENDVENMLATEQADREQVDRKTQQIEELRTAYRGKHTELPLLGSNYEESYAEDGKKRLMSLKNYILKANVVKSYMSESKKKLIFCLV